MAGLVEIIPWQESAHLLEKLRESATASDSYRAWMQLPEWVAFRWRPVTNTFIATLRDVPSGGLLAATPLVEHNDPLRFSIAGQELGTFEIKGLLMNGGVPAFPHSECYYEALCQAALAMPSVDCLHVSSLPKISPFWRFLMHSQHTHPEWLFYMPGFDYYRYFYIDMNMSYQDYLHKFKPTTLQKFRNRLRQLEKLVGGRVDLVSIRDPAEVSQFLAVAHSIAEKSWQRSLLGLNVDQPAARRELLESMARQGVLRSYLLRLGEKFVAFLIGFQSNGVYYTHETAFDQYYAGTRFSPGQLLFYLSIKDCFERDKAKIFYLGPGEYWYKNLFSNQSGEEVGIMILKNNAENQAKVMAHRIFRASINLVKRQLDPETQAAIRRAIESADGKTSHRRGVSLIRDKLL
jgi:hypothetical protein